MCVALGVLYTMCVSYGRIHHTDPDPITLDPEILGHVISANTNIQAIRDCQKKKKKKKSAETDTSTPTWECLHSCVSPGLFGIGFSL